MTKIAFDIDGTLIDETGAPRWEILWLLIWHTKRCHTVYVWSGGGVSYAETIVRRLGLTGMVTVVAKGNLIPDIAIDDEEVNLGKVNIQV